MIDFLKEKVDIEQFRTVWPLLIYRRVQMLAGVNYFFFAIDPGYWYWLRFIRAKWAEINAAGTVFGPEISIEVVESSIHRVHQNLPVPIRLLATPASQGVQVNAGNQMTATGPRFSKYLNEVRPYQDNITLRLSGQNATPFPAFVDIAVMGYMMPDKQFLEWKGTNDG